MWRWLEHLAARAAFIHARGVYRRFTRTLADVPRAQTEALHRALRVVAGGEFARQHGLDRVRTLDELRRVVPLQRYEDLAPRIERVAAGDTAALLRPGQRLVMFATSSGTTARRKLIPVTPEFVVDYRRGWNTFGLKLLTDHPAAVLRAILQISGRFDDSLSPAGIPCGAITGLLARTQKGIVRRYYVGHPEIAYGADPRGRYYALMRCAAVRDVAFAVTASPATLIRLAQTADEESERLIRDVRDGTLDAELVPEERVRRALARRLRPAPARAAELARARSAHGVLRPRDMWRLTFLACWTGGSMGHYLTRVADWWGPVPVRDVGLLASEGRVSIPLEDGTPAGVLDVTSGCFEFIPADQAEAPQPQTLAAHELEIGRLYAVVLTNTTGLVRYRLDDVVRVTGRLAQAPLVEFMYRAGRVASVAGEKLTEDQAVAAVRDACARLGRPDIDFVLAPVWAEPPYYRLSAPIRPDGELASAVDAALCRQNEEYESRRKSKRLGGLVVRRLPADAIAAMDRRLTSARGSTAEQYKRPCLFTTPGADDSALGRPITE